MICECWLCHEYTETEEHHIFGGALRGKSDRLGLTVRLCPECHREGPNAAHRSAETREILHKYGQAKVMRELGWTVDDVRRELGKNYLDEDELCAVFADEDEGVFALIEEEEMPF